MKLEFNTGDQALVVGKHPHSGALVTLLSYGRYGLELLNLVGWLVRGEDAQEFYCQNHDLEAVGQPLHIAADGQLQVVPAVEVLTPTVEVLAPTVSPGRQETTLDRLRAYYKAQDDAKPVLLTQHQQQVLKRYEAAWGLLLEFKSSEWALGKLMKNFKLSRAQAYRDLDQCKKLFGDVVATSKEAERYILKEMAMKAYRMAKKAGEVGEMNKALANLVKITGIEHDDPSLPDPETFLPSTYLLQMPAGVTGDKALTLNLETIAKLPAHQYEEVMDYIQNSGTSDLEMLRYIQEAARGTAD